jgi:ribosomal protein S18 acetylase RimI-like enzyme
MPNILYRQASDKDFTELAKIRAIGSGSVEYWTDRIENYWRGLINPQQALPPRIIYIASYNDEVVGFVAGHLTRRFNCEGELQWIDTVPEFQNRGIASHLIKLLASWFIDNKVYKVCVDPGNQIARSFYSKNGATNLNDHWMFWDDIRMII